MTESEQMELLSKIADMVDDDQPIEDILVFMIENKVQRVVMSDGTVLDPRNRVLH